MGVGAEGAQIVRRRVAGDFAAGADDKAGAGLAVTFRRGGGDTAGFSLIATRGGNTALKTAAHGCKPRGDKAQ